MRNSSELAKPFIVTSGKLILKFIPDAIGYGVIGVNVPGLNTQGDTFEEALANAHEAAALLAKYHAGKRAKIAKTPRRALAAV